MARFSVFSYVLCAATLQFGHNVYGCNQESFQDYYSPTGENRSSKLEKKSQETWQEILTIIKQTQSDIEKNPQFFKILPDKYSIKISTDNLDISQDMKRNLVQSQNQNFSNIFIGNNEFLISDDIFLSFCTLIHNNNLLKTVEHEKSISYKIGDKNLNILKDLNEKDVSSIKSTLNDKCYDVLDENIIIAMFTEDNKLALKSDEDEKLYIKFDIVNSTIHFPQKSTVQMIPNEISDYLCQEESKLDEMDQNFISRLTSKLFLKNPTITLDIKDFIKNNQKNFDTLKCGLGVQPDEIICSYIDPLIHYLLQKELLHKNKKSNTPNTPYDHLKELNKLSIESNEMDEKRKDEVKKIKSELTLLIKDIKKAQIDSEFKFTLESISNFIANHDPLTLKLRKEELSKIPTEASFLKAIKLSEDIFKKQEELIKIIQLDVQIKVLHLLTNHLSFAIKISKSLTALIEFLINRWEIENNIKDGLEDNPSTKLTENVVWIKASKKFNFQEKEFIDFIGFKYNKTSSDEYTPEKIYHILHRRIEDKNIETETFPPSNSTNYIKN